MRNGFKPVLASEHVANGASSMVPPCVDLAVVGGDRGTWPGALIDKWVPMTPDLLLQLRNDPKEWHRRGLRSPAEIELLVHERLIPNEPCYHDFFLSRAAAGLGSPRTRGVLC